MSELLHTAIPGLPPPRIGKVREVYDLGNEVLIVATDRISAFDVVMANGIPEKGMILTQMSAFWFQELQSICPNHLISTEYDVIQNRLESPHPELEGRSTLAKKAVPLPVECVVRGYITGSLFKEYVQNGGKIHGLDLPVGLVDGSELPEPIFSPATKAEEGHDENISFAKMEEMVGTEIARMAKDWSLKLYALGKSHAAKSGIILADTKFEFGTDSNGMMLIDEALTPDSSRFWQREGYAPGKVQASFDKQFVRNFLESSGWNKLPPGPVLPAEVVVGTKERYADAFHRITGRRFVSVSEPVLSH